MFVINSFQPYCSHWNLIFRTVSKESFTVWLASSSSSLSSSSFCVIDTMDSFCTEVRPRSWQTSASYDRKCFTSSICRCASVSIFSARSRASCFAVSAAVIFALHNCSVERSFHSQSCSRCSSRSKEGKYDQIMNWGKYVTSSYQNGEFATARNPSATWLQVDSFLLSLHQLQPAVFGILLRVAFGSFPFREASHLLHFVRWPIAFGVLMLGIAVCRISLWVVGVVSLDRLFKENHI